VTEPFPLDAPSVEGGSITDVDGIRVGHWTDREGVTGCTVVLCPPGTAGSVDVKGGAPGTRETDALRPGTVTPEVHAVVLTGGSAYGLAAADGAMRWLEERGVGFDTGVARVPIVPAAVLFDLGVGDASARPDAGTGRAACEAATGGPAAEGSVGAGTGATVAKDPDPAAGWKGGTGTASARDGDVVLGALAAVNALGAIVDAAGEPIAANRNPEGEDVRWPGTNTTLVVVATNARLNKERAMLLAQAGSEGIGDAVRPSHTVYDGDTVFALGTGVVDADQATLERLAGPVVAEAIRRGVRLAEPLGGVPAISSRDG
jgi:L-aminopeptidase/D-esterase-like protein